MNKQIHPDGIWNTHTEGYKGYVIMTKSRAGHGMKYHILKDDKVIYTKKYSFIKPSYMVELAKERIDKLV